MSDTIIIDVISKTIYPVIIPIINLPHPVTGYNASESVIKSLINIPNYKVYESGTTTQISNKNINQYFPHGGGGGGSGGTDDYRSLVNKPSINNVTLNGNKSANDLNLLKNTTSTNMKVGQVLTVGSISNNRIEDISVTDNTGDVLKLTKQKYEEQKESIPDGTVFVITDDFDANINATGVTMESYVKPSVTSPINQNDTVSSAIGKLENKVDNNVMKLTHYEYELKKDSIPEGTVFVFIDD